jgi:hypothetical protein
VAAADPAATDGLHDLAADCVGGQVGEVTGRGGLPGGRSRVLAQLARARRKSTELEEALEGVEFFTAERAALLGAMLAGIDRINEEIIRLSQVIERLLAAFGEQLARAGSMPGWGRRRGRPRRDRNRYEPVPVRRLPGLLGRAHPRRATSPARATERPGPRKATGTWPSSPARPPSWPAKPKPAKAPLPAAIPPPRQN